MKYLKKFKTLIFDRYYMSVLYYYIIVCSNTPSFKNVFLKSQRVTYFIGACVDVKIKLFKNEILKKKNTSK